MSHPPHRASYLDLEKKTSSGFYAENLTGVRALAVLWVLVMHTWAFSPVSLGVSLPWFDMEIGLTRLVRFGEWGVDIFFVLSGFLLTMPWIRNGLEPPTIHQSLEFYRRRLLRILPAFYFVLLVLIFMRLYGFGPVPTAAQVFQHALFINPWLGNMPLQGAFWSLPVEAYFYLFLPLILLLAIRVRSFSTVMLGLIVGTIAFRAFVLFSPMVENKGLYLFSFFGRVDQFVVGSLMAYIHFKRPLSARQGTYLLLVSIVLFLALIGFIDRRGNMFENRDSIYFVHQTIVAFVTGLLIYAASSPSKLAKLLFGNAWMAFIGTISYSVYLWHTVVLDLFMQTNTVTGPTSAEKSWAIFVYTWPAIFVISTLSYFLIERYFLQVRHATVATADSTVQKHPLRFLAFCALGLCLVAAYARQAQKIVF
ncbi:acyltransferase [Lampropedia puyangensis]|uniref:Acyltransferase n=1 Tax=Lampropedia puyangensis TaxID=1330072 RepID=A0A4S8F823_9BURK|nr:acyltransferase [Lampropedia puyangensis]THU03660.1 acyltransferase [Lampropedia puyangensis]